MIDVTSMMISITKYCNQKSNSLINEIRPVYSNDKELKQVRESLQNLLDLTGEIIYKSTI